MTQIFVSRAELMADGETTHEHAASQEAEAGIVERDKSNQDPRTGGLFRGCFKLIMPMPGSGVIHDVEDGVVRCPMCAWELEDGYCNSCQVNYATDLEGFSEDDTDLDVSADDEILSPEEADPSDSEDAERWSVPTGRVRNLIDGQADDISLDGDGFGLHTPHYNGDFHIARTAAQGLIGHPARRVDQAVSAVNPQRYTPSTLSDVATTHIHGFSDIYNDEEDDAEDDAEDIDDDEEEDEDDEADTSLDGFLVGDELDDDRDQPSEIDTDALGIHDHPDHIQSPNEGEAYWVDDSASDHQTHPYNIHNPATSSNSADSSDTEAPVQSQLTRKRRRIVQEASSDEESDSENDSERSRPRRKLSSSGSLTIGRQSPVLGSSSTAPERPPRWPRGRNQAPAVDFSGDGTDYSSDLPSQETLDRQLASRPHLTEDRHHSRPAHRQYPETVPYSSSSRRRRSDSSMLFNGGHFSRMQSDLRPPPLTIRRSRDRRHNRQVYSQVANPQETFTVR